jgi:lipoyl-dependent peroxiredoxin
MDFRRERDISDMRGRNDRTARTPAGSEDSKMKIIRKGSATWTGGLKDGKGAISTESGALDAHPYGFASRFEGVKGTNPEELLGAAHAGCFTMALSLVLGEAGLTATKMDTSAKVALEQVDGGFSVTSVHLTLEARIPGTDQATFAKLADKAKAGCPVSKLFNTEITLDAKLVD